MSDETHLYEVQSGKVRVPASPGEGAIDSPEVYREGDVVELREEVAEPFEVERVDEDGADEAESASSGDTTEGADEGEADALPSNAEDLPVEQVADASYEQLRSAASDYEDVNGNWGEDRLRAELRDLAAGTDEDEAESEG